MTDIWKEEPVIILGDTYKLFGILRDADSEKLIVFSPWVNGDRTGLSRIYVEAARALLTKGISSLCIDMPPNGYSYDSNYDELKYIENYGKYLEKTIQYLMDNFQYKEYIIIGFCSSAIPAIYVSRKYHHKKVLCLNPYDFIDVDHGAQAYEVFHDYFRYYSNKIDILYILSEKEENASRKREYLEKHFEDDNCNIKVEILLNTSHTYDGWFTKKKVIDTIINWI